MFDFRHVEFCVMAQYLSENVKQIYQSCTSAQLIMSTHYDYLIIYSKIFLKHLLYT